MRKTFGINLSVFALQSPTYGGEIVILLVWFLRVFSLHGRRDVYGKAFLPSSCRLCQRRQQKGKVGRLLLLLLNDRIGKLLLCVLLVVVHLFVEGAMYRMSNSMFENTVRYQEPAFESV